MVCLIDHLRGMAGILQFQKHIGDITVPYDREGSIQSLDWTHWTGVVDWTGGLDCTQII